MEAKDSIFSTKKTINCNGKLINLAQPSVMGILNITPDSFYEGSRKAKQSDIVKTAGKMLEDGAKFLDIGGYSSRPRAKDITEKEELKRVLFAIENILQHYPQAILSIDTFRANVAREAVKAGARIINDISAGNLDEKMFNTVAELQVPYIMMHIKGKPQNMQEHTDYDNLIDEVITYLSEKINRLNKMGVNDVLIDPGFGFAKKKEQSFQLLKHIEALNIFEVPIIVGVSRKSMIQKTLDCSAEDALNGTSILHGYLLNKGVNILRVHDVKEAVEAIKIYEMIC